DAPPSLAQLLPIGALLDDRGAALADRGGRAAQVRAQLRVGQLAAGGYRERRWVEAHARSSPVGAGGWASSVEARISARCTARTPVCRRASPPPMCSRHELSSAVTASAPESSTWRSLSVSIAA